MDNYSGYFLCSGNGANVDYTSGSVAAHPGATLQYSNGSEKNILLAGGFSSIHPGSSFALSSTLQLNGDLTEIDDTRMLALARAEFIRHNSQSFRSYSLEPDLRMTVIGASAESLKRFMDTYGGVLEIDPILTKGYDPELTTAQDLQISSLKNNFKISFSVKQAVDMSRCTYCGACGPACPEHCISEQLFLDFSNCNFCKECLAVCTHDAIDLYAVERRELITPAILLLDGTTVDLPEQQKNIYSEESLPDFFASLYATEVDEVIGWDSSICQYSARLGTGCTVCLAACLHGAVTQGPEGVQIDHHACIECGACFGSCPTGALQYKHFDDLAFVEYFRAFPLSPGTRVVLGEEEELHKYWWHGSGKKHEQLFFMEYPTVNGLHTMHLLLLYAMGAKQILVLGEAGGTVESQIKLSNALLQSLFKNDQAIILTNRHELDTILDQNGNTESLSRFYHDFSYGNRRKKLIDLLLFLRAQSEAEPENIATKTFGEIICDEDKCTQCIACVNDCRMEALVADSASYSLKHTPVQCVQCGICVTVCPERALTMKLGLAVQDAFFTEKVVSQADPAKCKGCGKVFGTRKALERVMAILSSKNMWDSDDDLLSYCEDCRVVNLYESSEKV
jgi:ferredoxin